MTLYSLIILALIQGITEFLPISSSGHLLLAHSVLDDGASEDIFRENLLIDVAVHVGTLFSVLLYFWRDVWAMFTSLIDTLTGKHESTSARLNIYVIISSLPVIAAGLMMNIMDFYWGHAIQVVGWTTLLFGIMLWHADLKPTNKSLKDMTWIHALLIGLAQAIALVPGTSRSGITMTAARYLGYSRTEATRYSLLLAIIAISGAGVLGAKDLIETGDVTLTTDALIAAGLSFVSALGAIALMMKWLEKASFKIFAIYRIILGVALLWISYSGLLL